MNHTSEKDSSNYVIQGLWIGNSLTQIEQLCIKSYQLNGHEFHLYAYDDIENIPSGTILKDANQIIPRSKIFLDSRGTVASFADWFRYKLLYEKGGWWVDMDNICIKTYNFEQDYCFSSEGSNIFMGEINNGVIKSKPNSDFLYDCLTFIESYPIIENVCWGEFGPKLLRRVLNKYECEKYIFPPITFCPIFYLNFKDVFFSNFQLPEQVFSIHLWNEMLRNNQISKECEFPFDSLFGTLKRKYSGYNI